MELIPSIDWQLSEAHPNTDSQLYKIIVDEQALKDFITWLPDLHDNEQFYLSLFARKKYDQNSVQSSDKTQLKRFTSDKSRMIEKIRQLEIPVGRYTLKGNPVTQESLVLYITPNPRCMKKATYLMGLRAWELYQNGTNYNIVTEALSCVQKSKSRACYVDFDIDSKDIDLSLLEVNGFKYYDVLETRGGYHILIDPVLETEHRKINNLPLNWHQIVREMYDSFDQAGDQLIPVAGCVQGGFIPKFVK